MGANNLTETLRCGVGGVSMSHKTLRKRPVRTSLKGSVWLPLLIAGFTLSVVGFAAASLMRRPPTLDSRENVSSNTKNSRKEYVNRRLLSSRLALHLSALGDRLEKPGQERLTVTGVLHLSVDSQPRPISATLEFPDRVRIVIQNGPQSRVITSDGRQQTAADELDLIETLAYDSAEHFFSAQMQGNATRFLGTRFRTDDGSSPDYNGPYFDIYKIADQIKTSGQERPAKLYYFNSDTLLLERVTYVVNRDGAEVSVETKLSDWRSEGGQKVARRIERLENGKSVFVFDIRSAQFGRRVDDGMFVQ
jgi:hypothetical protein